MRNPYTVLGIPEGADPQVIRRAYKKLAVEFHPDRNDAPEATARFKEVAEAYAVLTNDHERQRYARRRRQEHADREEYRRQQAAAAQRRSSSRQSETAAAAERAFWEYARQVQARRQQASQSKPTARPTASRFGQEERLSPALAVLLMAVYVWRSMHGLPLQPWLPASAFSSHPLTSPIWITLSLGLLMVVRPRWYQIPIVLDEVKDIRRIGWLLILIPPFLSSALQRLLQFG
ncbi:MAG: J domain-containing protein [Planctomycetaceae bacterium]|nr:J domain-containing protein [Planctomycetaceae bacterium]